LDLRIPPEQVGSVRARDPRARRRKGSGTVQVLDSLNNRAEAPRLSFNNIAPGNDGAPPACKEGMVHSSDNGRSKFRGWSGMNYTLTVACLVVLGTLSPAQTLSGSLGKQAANPGYATVSSAVASINLSAVLPASLGLSVSDVPLQISVQDPGTTSEIVRVPVTSFWH